MLFRSGGYDHCISCHVFTYQKNLSKDVFFCKYNETWCSPWIGFNIFYPVSHIYMYMNNLYISATLLVRVSLLFLIKKLMLPLRLFLLQYSIGTQGTLL